MTAQTHWKTLHGLQARSWLAGLLVAAFLLPMAAEAHVLPGDPQTLAEQLQSCTLDLFRTQRADGTYYAAHGNRALAKDFYPLIFRQQFRKRNPFGPRHDEDLARRLAPQMVDITLNLAYADALPSRSRRSARLKALMTAIVTEVQPHILRAVVGPNTGKARRMQRQTGAPPELLGAAALSLTLVDLYDKVAWGPSFVIEHRLPRAFGSNGWSLDGTPLSEVQFDLLVQEATTHLAGLDEEEKTALVGGSCLHAHPTYLEAVIEQLNFVDWIRRILETFGGGFGEVINVVAEDPGPEEGSEPADPPDDPTRRGVPTGGGDGGGGDAGGTGGGTAGGGEPRTAEPDDDCATEYEERTWFRLWPRGQRKCDADFSTRCVHSLDNCVRALDDCQELGFLGRRSCEVRERADARGCVRDRVADSC